MTFFPYLARALCFPSLSSTTRKKTWVVMGMSCAFCLVFVGVPFIALHSFPSLLLSSPQALHAPSLPPHTTKKRTRCVLLSCTCPQLPSNPPQKTRAQIKPFAPSAAGQNREENPSQSQLLVLVAVLVCFCFALLLFFSYTMRLPAPRGHCPPKSLLLPLAASFYSQK